MNQEEKVVVCKWAVPCGYKNYCQHRKEHFALFDDDNAGYIDTEKLAHNLSDVYIPNYNKYQEVTKRIGKASDPGDFLLNEYQAIVNHPVKYLKNRVNNISDSISSKSIL
jgi:hypothetical protein